MIRHTTQTEGFAIDANEFGDVFRVVSPSGETIFLTLQDVRTIAEFAEGEAAKYEAALRAEVGDDQARRALAIFDEIGRL